MGNKKLISQWEQHKQGAKEKAFYSIKRIDILTISISGACIYIAMEIFRFINTPANLMLQTDTILIKLSVLFSVVAILINFLSQFTGYQANQVEMKYSSEEIIQLKLKKKHRNDTRLEQFNAKSQLYNNWTNKSNIVASISMSLAIIFLIVFSLITF